jgi:hypothetical protein
VTCKKGETYLPKQTAEGNIIRRMRFGGWITKAMTSHSEFVEFIIFPRQQWLRERVSILRV